MYYFCCLLLCWQPKEEVIQTGAFALHRVPDVTVEVIVAGEQQPAGFGEGDGCDAADDVVVAVHGQLLVGADVEHAARRVVGTRRKREPGREELEAAVGLHQLFDNL